MKLSDKTTAHILVKANTNSEWDNCEFAIIHLSEEWKKEQVKRLALVKPLEGNHYFWLVLRANGTGYYTAYGKHTSEEFWTEEFLLTKLIA